MKAFWAIIIFAIAAIVSYYILSAGFHLHEGMSVIIALIVGLSVELFVRRKWK